MASPGGSVDINHLVLFGQHLQLTVRQFANMTLRQIVHSPSFSTIVNASPILLDKYHLGFGLGSSTEQGARILDGLADDSACRKGAMLCGILTAISFFLVLMRMSSRWISGSKLRWDDHLCWMAFGMVVLVQIAEMAACSLESVHAGRHFWDVTISQHRNILIFAFVLEFTYYPNLCLIKLSILIFYYYLFRSQPRLQRACKILAWILVFCNVFPIMGFFQFKPIDYWNHILDAKPAFHRYAYFSSIGYITIITDFILLALPMSTLPKMRLRSREKIILAFLFILGTCACIASILRLVSLKQFCYSQDWSYVSADTMMWSNLELHLAIFCACIPNLKTLASRIADRAAETLSRHRRLASSLSIIHAGKSGKNRTDDIECGTVSDRRSRRHGSEGAIISAVDDFDGGSKWSKSGVGCATMSVSSQKGMNDFVNPCEGGPTFVSPCAGGPTPSITPTIPQAIFPADFTPPTGALSPITSALEPIDFEREHEKHKKGEGRDPNIVVATGVLDSFDDEHDLERELREMVVEVEAMRRPRKERKEREAREAKEAAKAAAAARRPETSTSEKFNDSFETERSKKEAI